ncbi:MAG: hypothetical protein K0B81_00930 [Candidatus Cloacimonetes bacterium]|nr:hypothetical protein [Candidatus Cloacimonadota bacterium]
MKRYLILIWIISLTASLLSMQLQVVGEIITWPGCGPCLPARSALLQMYEDTENFGNLIPLIWVGSGNYTSPNTSQRRVLYQLSGIPYARWGGTLAYAGARDDVYEQYVQRYNQIANNPSPIQIALDYEITADGQLMITADVEMIQSITTTDNKIQFVVTYDLEEDMPGERYFANVLRYDADDFPLNTTGQTGRYTKTFDLEPWWNMAKANTVVIIQSFSDDKTIHQAASRRLD